MWQRFTERVRRVIVSAQEEAARLGDLAATPEHLLLALVCERGSVAARALERLGVGLEAVRLEVEAHIPRGRGRPGQEAQPNADAKAVINSAYEEARRLDDQYVGTEHLLLGLIRQQDSLAARILVKHGAGLERVRTEVRKTHDRQEKAESRVEGLRERLRELVARGREEAAGFDGAAAPAPAERRQWSYVDALLSLAAHVHEDRSVLGAETNALLAVDLSRHGCEDLLNLQSVEELSGSQAWTILALARILKETIRINPVAHRDVLPGRTLAMLFEKPSLRTRVSFEVGMYQLGGCALYLQPGDIQMGKRESVPDVARNLERMVDGIMARVFAHRTIRDLATYARVPVINGLCDREHPCQALADLLTVWERCGSVEGRRIAYVGDGNNVAHSLLLLGSKLGAHVVLATPEGYAPDPEIVESARAAAPEGGGVTVTADPREACAEADVIYTDVWASMGQEAEQAERARIFAPYQVNAELCALAKKEHIFMHCLPAHRGEEVTDEVVDGPNSVVFDQAENRLHAQKAVMAVLMG